MKYYEKLFFLKENKKTARELLGDFLLYQIYSVPVLRSAYPNWPALPWFLKKNTPNEIQELIEKSPYLSDKDLREKLNAYQIQKAVQILKEYQNCGVPLTQDPTIRQTRRKLTSPKGDKALKILQDALSEKNFSDKIARLAIRAGHKFLIDPDFFRKWYISRQFAKNLTFEDFNPTTQEKCYSFPAIQLTKGCVNHCSHCGARATSHLSHMPWPVFKTLYTALNKHYRHYPQKYIDHYFAQFFSDSDMLAYHDNIMNVDSGDVALWIEEEKGTAEYLTRGVTDERSRLALAKALLAKQSIAVSFVDTPKENMPHNLHQLNETLDVVESVPQRYVDPMFIHLHLKSGPSVSDDIFRKFPIEKTLIYAQGRANDFPANEVEQKKDKEFLPLFVFRPNGQVDGGFVENKEQRSEKLLSLYGIPPKGHLKGLKRFWYKHLLSHFR